MNSIRVDVRLRPIRFGFLVRLEDEAKIAEIFRINTCLWGGMFNPIIPFLKCVPPRWDKYNFGSENAKQIMNGYLDFFEPDFLVEANEGLADGLGFDSQRVLHLEDFLEQPGGGNREIYGLSVHDVYAALYTEIFRFETRHEPKIVSVEAKDLAYANFVASNFGSFPIQEQFGYFERDYKGVFNPEHVILDSSTLPNLYKFAHDTPISMSCAKVRINYHSSGKLRLFILNAKEICDLVDFWNLRIIFGDIFPIPIQWIEELSPFCKELILIAYRSLHYIPNKLPLSPVSMFSRSIPSTEIDQVFGHYLRVDEIDADMTQSIYLQIWREPPAEWVIKLSRRPILEADRRKLNIQISGDRPEIQFDSLLPDFANEYGNRYHIANVVRIHDWSHTGQIATVFPSDHRNSPFFKSFRYDTRGVRFLPTTEGLVTFPDRGEIFQRWNWDASTAFNKWFNANHASATPSDAGMATQQIIQTLGGVWGVGCLAHKGVIELLNRIAKRPVTKTANYQKFRSEIVCAVDDEELGERIFETLGGAQSC